MLTRHAHLKRTKEEQYNPMNEGRKNNITLSRTKKGRTITLSRTKEEQYKPIKNEGRKNNLSLSRTKEGRKI